jgi:hypothetical protein
VGSRAGMDTEVRGLRVLDSLPPFPQRSKQYMEPGRAVGHIKKCIILLAHHRKVKQIFSNTL